LLGHLLSFANRNVPFEISFSVFLMTKLTAFFKIPVIRPDSFKLLVWLLRTFVQYFWILYT
jgi:hypothetical protein